ncbi:MAG: DNA damage-inducible protein D [Microgenomates group bacterium]
MTNNTIVVFEQIKRVTESQKEYWSARDLARALEYTDYRNFELVVNKAREACKNSGQSIKNHFVDVTDMVAIGSGASREVDDTLLTRYACYLVMQNADPSKEVVALGQTYFAFQTRKQEVQEQAIEDIKRIQIREDISAHNKHLAEAASIAGVKNYGVFTNYGYRGLYGGLTMQDIHRIKRLKKSQQILNHMGSEELAANLFRATQTDAKIRRENIQGEAKANQAHFEVGRKVRQTIDEIGGTMPEKLPSPDGINKAKTRLRKLSAKKHLDE